MVFFIALPLVSVVVQSVFAPHLAVLVEVESCTPLLGCTVETKIDQDATAEIREAAPLGRFIGLDIFLDRGHLATTEAAQAWSASQSWNEYLTKMVNLPFYRAMAFTLTFTFVVTPLVIVLGLMIALAINSLHERLKGLAIFFSLLPFVVTPLIGSLVLFWMIDSRWIL